VGLYCQWRATESVALVFRTRGYLPVFQRRAEPDLPFHDQMLIGASITVLFDLGSTRSEDA
jgi:hypothetical protein